MDIGLPHADELHCFRHVLGRNLLHGGVTDMTTERNALKACEDAGQAARGKGMPKEANPYLKAAQNDSGHLLDRDSRKQLAEAWAKGWDRSNAPGK